MYKRLAGFRIGQIKTTTLHGQMAAMLARPTLLACAATGIITTLINDGTIRAVALHVVTIVVAAALYVLINKNRIVRFSPTTKEKAYFCPDDTAVRFLDTGRFPDWDGYSPTGINYHDIPRWKLWNRVLPLVCILYGFVGAFNLMGFIF